MSTLDKKIIAYLERTPDFLEEVIIQDDMINGESKEYIAVWNAKDKPKPTEAQLNAKESEATKLENNAKIDLKRRTEYSSWWEQMEMIYKDQKNGTTTFKDHCDKVRNDNPKET
tara:strand:- start:43 stop:384 length:342 start_codon:yes stop_codon:yes gene_type:complete